MNSELDHKSVDITNLRHVSLILQEIEGSANRRRKKEAWKAFRCSKGHQERYIERELKELYPRTANKFRKGNISIVKKTINKVAKAYKNKPKRSLKTDKETKALSKIYNKNSFNTAFKEADKIFNLHNYVALWLTYINPTNKNEKGKYLLRALAPYEYDVIRDEVTGEPLVFILSYAGLDVMEGGDGIDQVITENQADANTKKYVLWSKDYYAEVLRSGSGKGEGVSLSYIKKDVNYLGELPFTFLSKDTSPDYPLSNNITEQSIEWNVSFSDLKTASSTQGHGQLVIKYPEGQKQKNRHMGMHTSINLPQSRKDGTPATEANYISASPDLVGQLDVLKFDLISILEEHGIQGGSSIQGGADQLKSGFDRLLKQADTQDIVEETQSYFVEGPEQGVYKFLKAYEDYLNTNIFSSEEVEVYHEKPKVLITDKETLDNIQKREDLGLLLPWEKHLIINPNLTETQAKKREEEIQASKKEKMIAFQEATGAMNNPINTTIQDPTQPVVDPTQDPSQPVKKKKVIKKKTKKKVVKK